MVSRKTIKKSSSPSFSNETRYAINLYKNDKFLVAYIYEGWDINNVKNEVTFLKNRFPDYRGFKVELS